MVKHNKFFKDWKLILVFFIVSIVLTFIAFTYQNVYLKYLNIFSWIILTFYLYKDIFGLVNLLDMSNDFLLWILRIIGIIIGSVGLSFGGIMFFTGLIKNADPLTMGLSTVFFGLGFLGVFMVFRSRRRYAHIYVNK